jgi:hypothetical protein
MLSHYWGDHQAISLTQATFKIFTQDINFAILPPTSQDALKTTLSLVVKYLWINSLCIIQDLPGD